MAATLYPIGYSTRLVPIEELRRVHEPKMHPVFAARLFAWIEAQGGKFGIGGGWRETQPLKDGVAPEGQSFHQYQTFRSGLVAYCAVDLVCVDPGKVHRAPKWSEVPAQGSEAAARWGVHCNVGTPTQVSSEPWHMQPIEIDGWQSWVNAGRPDPIAPKPDVPQTPPEEPDMARVLWRPKGYKNVFAIENANAIQCTESLLRAWGYDLNALPVTVEDHPQMLKAVLAKSGLTAADLVKE